MKYHRKSSYTIYIYNINIFEVVGCGLGCLLIIQFAKQWIVLNGHSYLVGIQKLVG